MGELMPRTVYEIPKRYWPCGVERKPYPPSSEPTGAELAEAFQEEIRRMRGGGES